MYFSDLKKQLKKRPELDQEKIHKAYMFAEKAHNGQKRSSGQDYITHPVAVAVKVCLIGGDEESIIAALLHDTVEDTSVTNTDIKRMFGPQVSELVHGLTTFSKLDYLGTQEERHSDNFLRMTVSATKDLRVVAIKLLDRLHNLETISYLPVVRQKRLARETLQMLVPLADIIGMRRIMIELEDTAFSILDPASFQQVSDYFKMCNRNELPTIRKMMSRLQRSLKHSRIPGRTMEFYRSKFALFQKTNHFKIDWAHLPAPIGISVITKNKSDCYRSLEIIHGLYRPQFNRMKDYVARPKENGYAALHTGVFALDGFYCDIHIMSEEMYKRAEQGLLRFGKKSRSFLHLLNDIITLRRQSSSKVSFFEKVKKDILQERIYVFTVENKVLDLPKSATLLDAAYSLNGAKGNYFKGGKINNVPALPSTRLRDGDIVKMDYDSELQIRVEWQNMVKSPVAQKYLQEYFQSFSQEQLSELGRQAFEKVLMRFYGRSLHESREKLLKGARKLKIKNLKTIFIRIGEGSLSKKSLLEASFTKEELLFSILALKYTTGHTADTYAVQLQIEARDRPGLIGDIIHVISDKHIDILESNTSVRPESSQYVCVLGVEISSFDELYQLCEELETIKGINTISKL